MGQSTYLEIKVEAENSMPMKRRAWESGYCAVPQDPVWLLSIVRV